MKLLELFKGLSTTEVSDALDSCNIEGALIGIRPLASGHRMVGRAFTVQYKLFDDKPQEYHSAGDYIDEVPAESIIVIDNAGRQDCTTWGGILTHVAKSKKINGTVIFGAARDVDQIKQQHYPLYCSAVTMRSGKNRVYKSAQQTHVLISGITVRPNDIIFGDDNGVIVIPSNRLLEIIDRARNIKITEAKIIASVYDGMALAQARKLHGYATPWVRAS